MRKTIFISCGQYSDSEKLLGKQISEMVRQTTDFEPFFAEEVQDLNGLDTNILEALRDCVAFITVLHPRGDIQRPNGGTLTRASVWIEQEIAIATYIQRFENRPLPIIAFKHKSVGREGIRDLLHLNPIEFTDEADVLAELPSRLKSWKSLKPRGIELQLTSRANRVENGHYLRLLEITLVNETNQRIENYELEVRIPSSILKHQNTRYMSEEPCNLPGLRCFRFNQVGRGAVRPHDRQLLTSFEYCTACGATEHGGVPVLVAETKVGARAWVNEIEYPVEKTIKQLAMERDGY